MRRAPPPAGQVSGQAPPSKRQAGSARPTGGRRALAGLALALALVSGQLIHSGARARPQDPGAGALAGQGAGEPTRARTRQHQGAPAPGQHQHQHQHQHLEAAGLAGVRARWRQMERALGARMRSTAAGLGRALDEALQAGRAGVSGQCQGALRDLLEALAEQRLWASQMLDASARLPAGLLEGTLTELGNFDQCLAIGQHQHQWAAPAPVAGQYCSLQVKPALAGRPRLHTACRRLPALSAASANQTLKLLSQNSHQFYYAGLRLGICTPDKCAQADVQHLLSSFLAKYELIGQVKSCQQHQPAKQSQPIAFIGAHFLIGAGLDLVQQCVLLAFALLLGLTLVGTLLDSRQKRPESPDSAAHRTGHPAPTLAAAGVTADLATANQRRWHYQVYCGSSTTCSELRSSQFDETHSPGLQRNPLAEFVTFCKPSPPIAGATQCAKTAHAGYECSLPRQTTDWLAQAQCANLRTIGKLTQRVPPAAAPGTHTHDRMFRAPNESMSDIKVIHGLRTFAMVWIIFGHTIGLVNPEMMNNLFPLANLSCSSRFLQAILNATLAVNTFFMISGLVTTISFARKCKSALALIDPLKAESSSTIDQRGDVAPANKHDKCNQTTRHPAGSDIEVSSIDSLTSVVTSLGSSASSNRCIGLVSDSSKARSPAQQQRQRQQQQQQQQQQQKMPQSPSDFQPLLWLLMRYLRLTPTYAATIGISILMPALGSGPFWNESVGPMGTTCRRSWWLNLLYVNNFIETDKLCLIHSWYLSNDWQFFLMALILFAAFYKSKKLALLLVITFSMASSAATFALTVAHEFPPTIVTTSPAVAERWLYIHSLYYKPWPHMSSYLVGLVAGYLILIRDRIRLGAGWRRTCWILFTLVAIALLNSIYPWNMGIQVDPMITGLHSATFRTLWAICCAWLVFALASKPRNPLALFLSWHGFQVTSRLTYCAYLVHPLVIYYHFGVLRERMDSSMYGQLHRFMATLVLSYLFAFILSLLVESPSIQIQRLLINSRGGARSNGDDSSRRHKRGSESSNAEFSWTTSSSAEQTSAASLLASTESFKLLMASELANRKPSRSVGGKESRHKQHQLFAMQNCYPHSVGAGDDDPDNKRSASEGSISACDEDFQRRLAQAIGKGFKIRSRIFNGTIKQAAGAGGVPARRFGPAKRLPTTRAGLAPIFAGIQPLPTCNNRPFDSKVAIKSSSMGEDTSRPLTGQSNKTRRGETNCSTFVASCDSPQYTHHQPASSDCLAHKETLKPTTSGSGDATANKMAKAHQMPATNFNNPINLNEMLQIGKQKLQTRSQEQKTSKTTSNADVKQTN